MATGTSGADTLIASGPGDTLKGLEGDDVLYGDNPSTNGTNGYNIVMDGGAGNDAFHVTGDSNTITGGAGQDTIWFDLPDYPGASGSLATVIKDFAAGAGGDRLNFTTLLASASILHGYDGSNPFASGGLLQLQQVGADTVINWHGSGSYVPMIVLQGVAKSALTSENLGFNPAGGAAAPVTQTGDGNANSLSGGSGDDTLSGLGGNDTLSGYSGNDRIDGGAGNDSLDGGPGNDTLLGGDGDDNLTDNSGQDLLDGGAGNDVLFHQGGSATLIGGDGKDAITAIGSATISGGVGDDLITLLTVANATRFVVEGGDGNDLISAIDASSSQATLTGGNGDDTIESGDGGRYLLQGGAGSDSLIGGSGFDLMVMDLPRAALAASLTVSMSDGTLISSTGVSYHPLNVSGTLTRGTEVDSFSGIESIQFADGRLVFDPGDAVGQVSRMYLAALGRAPDTLGLNSWTSYLQQGHSINDLAEGFIGSAEFQARYPAVSNGGFVTLLYQNTLGRAPDPDGYASWVNYMNAGHTKVELLTGFSESAEHYARTASLWTNGIWDMDETGAAVARLYYAALGRAPDVEGWQSWTNFLKAGHSTAELAAGFPASAEFQARYPNVSNAGYIKLLYENTLGREPDQSGYDAWLSYMNQGHSRAEVLQGFAESQEFIIKTLPLIDGGITFA